MLKSNFKNFQTGVPRAVLGEPVLRTPRRRTSRCWGFTLVELLVVISIISTLASTVLASLNEARVKARDAARTQTVAEYKKAFYLYLDKYGEFPNANSCVGDADGDGQCGFNETTIMNTTIAVRLDEFIKGPPPIEQAFYSGTNFSEGLRYVCSFSPCTIYWALEKDNSCPGGKNAGMGTLCSATFQ